MLRIQITTGASQPIYRQVVDQVRHAVATGKVAVGDPLPSVRALAGELVVNPNTIAKAFATLVRDGVIESQQGRGYFVAQRREIYTHKERVRRLAEVMDPFLAEALSLGFDEQQIVDEVQKRLRKTFSSSAPKS
ncbi:HTH-type transcriptional repressor YtrA [Rubripirellula tenax]|uniref:HTH-type transcriptional repressor YtrA n=1 Tax=Rubripirellula tenax TaxID=2528015 RepID=A0A5C6FG45_9BACT|nr:GntR family transcriptional regulator [Rubripirellula tenax]TWU59780.1 HTH-type transcriptional repressor YtrA [Rubripirellula tenax]